MNLEKFKDEWSRVRACFPEYARKEIGGGWTGYYDGFRDDCYRKDSDIAPKPYIDIVEYLKREKMFRAGDMVLDVGCGPGAFTLLFAFDAGEVCGLDISARRLRRLSEEIDSRRLTNVRTIKSSWTDYVPGKRYDLVFSSYCEGVNDYVTLLKMEKCSCRSCCYVSSGGSTGPNPVYQLWEQLAGVTVSASVYDISYPLNVLLASGRNATVEYFKIKPGAGVPIRKAIDNYVSYFRIFMEVDSVKRNIIRDFVEERSKAGMYRATAGNTMGVVCWDIL